ncbi:hypothetical protein [Cohaesibacter celericrescens]|uniref:Transfer Agent n=1 Tax=Cohaesibacter celericrescens TaxID=2067669 RepID=A0A2N5XQM2_9HYPH|nr:hypothetical protein [Cohaesibacter celericrescens]PLW76803.1 hypothetical protein C0081_12130 [Cohaesibacter celericrescens]
MENTVNELTGEVSLSLGKHSFTLQATMPNVAALMAELGITGLRDLQFMLAVNDPRVTYGGLKCLCVSDNRAAIEGLLFGKYGADANAAISAALAVGMPEAEDKPGKPPEATTKSRGSG